MPIWIKLVWPNPTQLMMHCQELLSLFNIFFPWQTRGKQLQWNRNTFSRWILYRQSSGFTALKSFTITMNNCTKVMEIITDIFSNFWLLTECHTTIYSSHTSFHNFTHFPHIDHSLLWGKWHLKHVLQSKERTKEEEREGVTKKPRKSRKEIPPAHRIKKRLENKEKYL